MCLQFSRKTNLKMLIDLGKKPYLETSRAPIDKLDGPLGLDDADGSIDILGDNITTVQHAAKNIKIQYFRKISNFYLFLKSYQDMYFP